MSSQRLRDVAALAAVLLAASCTDPVRPLSVTTARANVSSTSSAYTITDLGTLGGYYGLAFDISDADVIVGRSLISDNVNTHAFVWRNGTMSDIGTLGGPWSGALAVNKAGDVVGESANSSGDHRAFVWRNGTMTDLGSLGGWSAALGINDAGQIAGYSGDHAVIWENASITDLGTGVRWLQAWNINTPGDVLLVAARSTVPGDDGPTRVLVRHAGTTTDVGNLGGTWTWARALNDAGQVAGYSALPGDATYHAFLWQNGTLSDLGTLGGDNSIAWGISESGDVVGEASTTAGFSHAVLWHNGVPTDLGTLPGNNYSAAFAMNAAGDIVGYADVAPETHVVVWRLTSPRNRQDCKNGGWSRFGFRNQGACVTYAETGRDTR